MSLPLFSDIKLDTVLDDLNARLDIGRQIVRDVSGDGVKASWYDVVEPLQAFDVEFSNFWAPVSHLWSVMNSSELNSIIQQALPLITEFQTEMGQNEALYKKYVRIAQSETYQGFDDAKKSVIQHALRDFRLSGVGLSAQDREAFKEKSGQLAKYQAKFEQNLLEAGNAWQKHIADKSELKGLPESALAMFRAAAREKELDGFLLTLDFPFYLPVMQYAENRALRQEMYRAYSTRASEFGLKPEIWDNTQLIHDILKLRHEMARILDFQNYAELSLATKMAETPDQVLTFLEDLANHSTEPARQEYEELQGFAASIDPSIKLEAWDIPFYSEKLRQERFAFQSEDVRPYFPVERVLQGLFDIVSRLFGVHVVEKKDVDLWHQDARFFEIRDDAGVRGQFYLDLYARPRKRGGAWMDGCRDRCVVKGELQLPVAFLVCNFSPPVDGNPSLLTHEEVMTIFHEFGHGIHHMLTKVNHAPVSGINGVPWDAVELPSQFLENWCWQEEALLPFARHYRTGAPLPNDLFEKMKRARNFQSGMKMVRQLEFALFDFMLHYNYNPDKPEPYMQVLKTVRESVAAVPYPEWNRFPNSFHHVFGGGYAAGYYSYKWAEVLSADAFSLFKETGIFNRETGQAFLEEILERGGSAPAMDLFKAFRGRPPETDALLIDSGLLQAT